MASTPTCPECDQMDRVIRVSSSYRGGIASQTSRSSGVGVTFTGEGLTPSFLSGKTGGVSQSEVSRRLAPVSAPVVGTTSVPMAIGDFLVELVLGLGGLVLLVLAPSLLEGSTGSKFIGVMLILAYAVALWRVVTRQTRLSNAAARHARLRKEILMSWYQDYLHAWDSLYYCERCDVVFAADRKKVVRPEQMNNLLFGEVGEVPRYNDIKTELKDGSGPQRRL